MAERLTLHLFKQSRDVRESFSESIRNLSTLRACSRCFHIAEDTLCAICADQSRDASLLSVVEEPMDVIAMERTRSFHGRYHVLGGILEVNPKNSNENALHVNELLRRIPEEHVREIIIATNPTTEGDMTALYLRTKLEPLGVIITRLGRGLATGGDIEYADDLTLSASLTNRREMK